MKNSIAILAVISTLVFGSCTKEKIDHSGFAEATALAPEVEPARVMQAVEALAAAHLADPVKVDNTGFPPADLFQSDQLTRDSALQWLIRELESLGYTSRLLSLEGEGSLSAHNLVAELPGTGKAAEVVLVGVHHDAFYAGADDNGSSVAAMLEAARIIRNYNFARSVRLVSFDLEEFGGIGSTRFVEAGYAGDVVAAIVLDAVGYASHEAGSQRDVMGIDVPGTGDYLFVIGNEQSAEMTQRMVALSNSSGLAKVEGILAPGDGAYFLSSAFMRSDHAMLWYRGIPAVFLTDGANFRNPHYHTPGDTAETLDPEFLADNTRLLVAAIALFAEIQQP